MLLIKWVGDKFMQDFPTGKEMFNCTPTWQLIDCHCTNLIGHWCIESLVYNRKMHMTDYLRNLGPVPLKEV